MEKTKEISIKKNMIFSIIYRVINMVFPLVTVAYVSHVLMASGVGKVNRAQNIAQYFLLLAPLGIVNYGTREIARIRDDERKVERLITELLIINALSTLICIVLYYSLVSGVPFFDADKTLFYVVGIPLVFNLFNVEWFYQGCEEYVYITIRSMLIKCISLILIFMLVKTKGDYLVYALIYALGLGGNHVFNFVKLIKKRIKFDFASIRLVLHIKSIFFLFLSNIAIELYTLLDTTMLGYMCTDAVVGYYTNSIRLVKIIVSLISAIGAVLLPRLSYYKEQNMTAECNELINKVTKVMLFFAIPSGLGIALLAEPIVLFLFGKSFIPAISTIRIATGLIYVLGFSNLFGTQILLTFKQEQKLLICTVLGAMSNIILNIMLIPNFQHNGAIVASVISESIVTFMTFLYAKSYISINVPIKYVIQLGFAGFGMSIIVFLLLKVLLNSLLCITISVILGSIVYFYLCIICGNSIALYGQRVILKHIRYRR